MAKDHGTAHETPRTRPQVSIGAECGADFYEHYRNALSPKSAQNTAVTGAANTFLALPPSIVVDNRSLATASRTKITLQGWMLKDDGALENETRRF